MYQKTRKDLDFNFKDQLFDCKIRQLIKWFFDHKNTEPVASMTSEAVEAAEVKSGD